MKKIRVLIVDDSALMRRVVSDIVASDEGLELAAIARDGLDALEKIKTANPDVITMDIDMPRLSGLEALNAIMLRCPMPVIILSSHSVAGSAITIKALEAGAVDFMPKPSPGLLTGPLEQFKKELLLKIKAAASARLRSPAERLSPEVPAAPPTTIPQAAVTGAEAAVILAVGSSTGGPRALETFFGCLPADLPAVVLLSQHMPAGFTASFAQRLNQLSALKVKEAKTGDRLLKGCALVAPGDYHLVVQNGAVRLDRGPKVNFVRPSIDVMLHSLQAVRQKVVLVIMTGMGKDGAEGARVLKKSKSDLVVIAQDPATALIPSMPEALIKSVACDFVLPLEVLAPEVSHLVRLLSAS